MAGLSRRDFISLAPAMFLAPQLFADTRHAPVVLAIIYAPEFDGAARAAEMSAAEVERAARLLKREFELLALPQAEYAAMRVQPTALIAATSKPIEMSAATIVDVSGTLPCAANVLKLRPAITQSASPPLRIWHHTLDRYGAAQLNDRFRAAGITPDDQAWLGWFAVKLLWEAGVRGRAPQAMSYDGHKGMALRFNDAGMLVQPLYVVENDRVTREIRPGPEQEHAACVS